MVTIRFIRDSRERLSAVFADGHADAAIAGDDLVCGAASTIVQTAELGLLAYARVIEPARRDAAAGSMRIVVAPEARDRPDVRAILGTAELAVAQLAQQFPENVRYLSETDAAEFG